MQKYVEDLNETMFSLLLLIVVIIPSIVYDNILVLLNKMVMFR
jgi:hypothetical protein